MNEQKLRELYWEFFDRVENLKIKMAKEGESKAFQKIQKDLELLLSKLKQKATESKIDLGAKEDTAFEQQASNDWAQMLSVFKLDKDIQTELVRRFNILGKYPSATQTNVLIEAIQDYCKENLESNVADAVAIKEFENVKGKKITEEDIEVIKQDYVYAFRKALSSAISKIDSSFKLNIGSPVFVFNGSYISLKGDCLTVLGNSSLPAVMIEQITIGLTKKINSDSNYLKPTAQQMTTLLSNAEKYYNRDVSKEIHETLNGKTTKEVGLEVSNAQEYTVAVVIESVINSAPKYVWEEQKAHDLFEKYYKRIESVPKYIKDDNNPTVEVGSDIVKQMEGGVTYQFKVILTDNSALLKEDDANKERILQFNKTPSVQISIVGSYAKKPHVLRFSTKEAKEEIAEGFLQFGRRTISVGKIRDAIAMPFMKNLMANTKASTTFVTGGVGIPLVNGVSLAVSGELVGVNYMDWADNSKKSLESSANMNLGVLKIQLRHDLLTPSMSKDILKSINLESAGVTISFAWVVKLNKDAIMKIAAQKIVDNTIKKGVESTIKKGAKVTDKNRYNKVKQLSKTIKDNVPEALEGVKDALSGRKPTSAARKAVDNIQQAASNAEAVIGEMSDGPLKSKADDALRKALGYADDAFKVGLKMFKTPAAKLAIKTAIKFIPIVGQIFAVFDAVVTVIQVVKFAYDNWDEIKKIFSSNTGTFEPVDTPADIQIDGTRVEPNNTIIDN